MWIAVAAACPVVAWADNYYYTGPNNGNWDGTPDGLHNWLDINTATSAFVVPAGSNAFLLQSGTNGVVGEVVNYNYNYPTNSGIANLTIDSSNTLSLALANSSLAVSGQTIIGNIGTGAFTQSSGTVTLENTLAGNPSLIVGNSTGANGSVTLSGGIFRSLDGETIGNGGGKGTFLQSGGLHSVSNLPDSSPGNGNLYISVSSSHATNTVGTYILQGGTLIAGDIELGNAGTARFEQSGGSVSAAYMQIALNSGGVAAHGTYNMSAGASLSIIANGNENIGQDAGQGTFNQTGGAHTISGTLTVGTQGAITNGIFNLSGGSLRALGLTLAQSAYVPTSPIGIFNQTGGTFTVTSTNSLGIDGLVAIGSNEISPGSSVSGLYSMSGGTLNASVMTIGQGGNGALVQAGGSIFLSGTGSTIGTSGLVIGSGSAFFSRTSSVTLSGGLLQVTANEYIGVDLASVVNQSGGTNSVAGGLYLGYHSGTSAVGVYNMSNGATLSVGGSEYVGNAGTGTFNQSGGTHSVVGTLYVQPGTAATGAFNLSGGSLSAGAMINQGTFSQTGGSLTSGATVNQRTFNQSGGFATLGSLSGTNGIFSVGGGAGTALATVANFSQGTVSLSAGGTLVVMTSTLAHYTNTASSLTVGGSGNLDLGNHNLLTSTPASTIRQYLINGYNGGAWNGTGGITSSWAAGDTNHAKALGYNALTNGATLVAATLYGDTNLKGSVGLSDYNTLAANFNKPGVWAQGDFDYDGVVTLSDYNKLAQNFNKTASMLAARRISRTTLAPTARTSGFVDPGSGNVALEADPTTGELYIVGHDSNISSYEVDSAAGKLTFVNQKSHGGYNTLTAQTATSSLPGSSNPSEDSWAVISSAAGTFVAEAYPAGDSPAYDTIGSGLNFFDLNVSGLSAWTAGTPVSDLTFKYGDGTGETLTPAVIDLSATGALTPAVLSASGVPEPASLSLIGIAAARLLSRKRRRVGIA